ncbi:MAG: tRNA preQ1(34) S-adenosylmethionine ribosyltransferase-isomerase QueA [Desulfobacteraceae bacterium]|nr:tRNA preQ1(34) S-adenosylmethionine ribosyltransferase-isomerase QueA [Desulfobacteraceae bacterium]
MSKSGTKDKSPGYDINDFDYKLPEDLIAQYPADQRENSRLMLLDRKKGGTEHRRFLELPGLLNESDVLVVNNTRVIPARLLGHKESGGRVEVLIIDYAGGKQKGVSPYTFECSCLIRASRPPKPGTKLVFESGVSGRVISSDQMTCRIEFTSAIPFTRALEEIGRVPLPPYIRRSEQDTQTDDRENYQTVYAVQNGAVAAPTAGFHFSDSLLGQLQAKGIEIIAVTLHVSYGTFMPVRVSDIREHRMHREHYHIDEHAAERINRARQTGRRIVAVGTTSVRTLEYAANKAGRIESCSGECDLFIYPGYRFNIIDAMITNFHLPKSTLLMLVSAFAGRKNILAAYREATEKGYRFFSYGDAMMIQ